MYAANKELMSQEKKKEEKDKASTSSSSKESLKEDTEMSMISRKPLIGVIEIQWDGKVHRTCFPLPLESKYLTAKTQDAFLDKVTVGCACIFFFTLFYSLPPSLPYPPAGTYVTPCSF
jgi:hypothetical protein